MDKRINIYFPIEITVRELDFRLYLAGICASPANRILIGQHELLYAHALKSRGGVYVGKNLFRMTPPRIDASWYYNVKERNVTVVHLDDEGNVGAGTDPTRWQEALSYRLDPACLEADDWICTWGDFQRDFYRASRPKCVKNVHTTGHPRFDLPKLKYRPYMQGEAKALTERYGSFVLVNTSFGFGNNAAGPERSISPKPSIGLACKDSKFRDERLREWLHERNLSNCYIALVHRLSNEFPQINIVVRPHPGENRLIYDAAFEGVRNVRVVRTGSVQPWLVACAVMIHDRCSTGVEAALAGANIINYAPIPDNKAARYLESQFGAMCQTEDDVLDAIGKLLEPEGAERPVNYTVPARAHLLLANFREDSMDHIAKTIWQAQARHYESATGLNEQALKWLARRSDVIATGKDVIRPLFRERQRRHEANVFSSTFGGIDPRYVERKIAKIEQMTHTRLRHDVIGNSMIVIEAHA